jgi:hypothetical protein
VTVIAPFIIDIVEILLTFPKPTPRLFLTSLIVGQWANFLALAEILRQRFYSSHRSSTSVNL